MTRWLPDKNKFLLAAFLMLGSLFVLINPAAAQEDSTPQDPGQSIRDQYCLSCHGQTGLTLTLADGSLLDLYVNPIDHQTSVHGSKGYACVQCHYDIGEYPHPLYIAADQRDATINFNQLCQRCHTTQFERANDSVHSRAIEKGIRQAAVCTDCHSAHNIQEWVDNETGKELTSVRTIIPQTCAKCHNLIYEYYLTSVHGSALNQENNLDVPTCIDCHGVHNIEDAETAAFRLASPQICAKCHTDSKIMNKYGISTDVLSTYVADFHGTTVTIFNKQTPDAETNKPVCFDCHGVHNIKRANDPVKGLHVKENLLSACQKCHPDANENFPTSWLSHYIPSPDKYPVVYYVNLFYDFLIPTVLGGMAALVALDVSRKFVDSRKALRRKKNPKFLPPEEPAQEDDAITKGEPQNEEASHE